MQFTYQFAHEFCHVVSGYERLKDNPNSWFHEAICELASIFTLRRMLSDWKLFPRYVDWYRSEECLGKYVEGYTSRSERKLPEGKTLQQWISENEKEFRGYDQCQETIPPF